MFLSRTKISTKLLISSAVFLIPIGFMLIFICTMTVGVMKKGARESDTINALKPIVTVMRNLPEYLNIYLGLEQGDVKSLDERISSAVKTLNRDLRGFLSEDADIPNLSADWETLKKIEKNDKEITGQYLNYIYSLQNLLNQTGEHSRLILVSDINTYYFVASALSSMPEAYIRLTITGNLLRKNLYDAENIVAAWNSNIAESQSQGRRFASRMFEGDPKNILMSMIDTTDLQLIRNSRVLFESDKNRIISGLTSAMGENAGNFDELIAKMEQYQKNLDTLSRQYDRMMGFNVANPCTVAEFLDTVSQINTDLCQLWDESFYNLDTRITNSTSKARSRLFIYLSIVFISLGLACGFVLLILRDLNLSVRSLKTLFTGLKENDLTLTLPINSKDEFGELMIAFNGFLDILRSTFGSFKQSAQMVADSVFDISSSSKEITTTANEQSASVSEIVSTMESSKNLSEQIALKTSEVANLSIETQGLSSKGADIREANQNMMEDIRKQNQKIISEIRNLSDMINRISEAIRIIDSIADQTKLIAFNASLEASSSGEAGARFSVVASEIRRFADNVAESTREIKQKIEEVQGASRILITEANSGSRQIEIGYERMSEQKTVFENIVDNSQNVAARSQQISNLSKQQELASSQIFTALKEISAGVKQFVIATSSTSKTADNLNGMSEELKRKVEKYRTED